MTTKHPAHGPVSLDRLHQISEILSKAATQSDGGNLGYAMADAVKVIDGVLALRNGEQKPAHEYTDLQVDEAVARMEDEDDMVLVPRGVLGAASGAIRHPGHEAGVTLGLLRHYSFRKQPEPEVPDTLPCPVHLEPGLKFGKGVRTQCVLDALRRRADYYAELEAMTPEQRAEHDSGIAEFKAMLGGGFRDLSQPVDPQISEYEKVMLQAGNSPVTPDGLLGCGENCWSCGKYFTYEQHSECDGYCPHCNSPVDLDDKEDQPSKVVPTNPTEEMISNAWREAIGKCDHETIKRIYATMLAAAPQREG